LKIGGCRGRALNGVISTDNLREQSLVVSWSLKRDLPRNSLSGRTIEFGEVGHCRSRYLIEGKTRKSLSNLNGVIGCCILGVRDRSFLIWRDQLYGVMNDD
jgi:hypothetical protein